MAGVDLKAIKCGRLIDGNGAEPLENATVIVEGSKIKAVGKDIPIPAGATVIDAAGKTVMPGMIDSHLHLSGYSTSSFVEAMTRPREVALVKAISDCKVLLAAGFTTVRCCARPNSVMIKKAVAEGLLTGVPRIIAAGYGLTQTNGHADRTFLPIECVDVRTSGHNTSMQDLICDGVPECIKATRYALRFGADFIKIMVTDGQVLGIEFNPDEIKAIVETAAQVGKSVAAHSFCSRGSKNGILGGVKTLEHAFETNDEVIELAKEHGVIFVSTLAVLQLFMEHGKEMGMPPWMIAEATEQWSVAADSYKRIRKAGARLAMGTDYIGRTVDPFGKNAIELELLVRHASFTPMEAIVAATKHGAMACFMGDKTGTIEAGKYADIIIVDGDPLDNITILQALNKIKLVMVEGKVELNRGI
jgi:imidazolonepropionase-like amidohydrolase